MTLMTVTTLMTSHEDRVASLRNDIDQAIRKHDDEVRELRYKRNMLSLTSILPPEILSKIFVLIAEACASHSRPSSRLNWIKVSHVSRHWRSVALECPALWSNIVFTTASGAQEMLRRSKAAPLSIRVDFDLMTPKMVEAVQNALAHIPRTTHLSFTASSGTMDKLMSSLQQPAHSLQSLFIANTYPSENYKNNRYNFPSSFLNGDAPNLRDLELQRCSIPWDSPLFASLHNLKIADPGVENRPTNDQLLDLLEMAYGLKSLNLMDCLPVLSDKATITPNAERIVKMPSLTSVQLSGTTLECANLLNHIFIAPTTSIKLVCMGTEATGDDFSSLTCVFENTFQQIHVKRLQIQSMPDNMLRIQAWTTSDSDNKVPKSLPHLDLELSWKQYTLGSAERVVQTICKSLPLSHLRILHVWQAESLIIQGKTWVSLFGTLPKLRTIDLHGHKAVELVDSLRVSCESPTVPGCANQRQRSPKPMAFPGLRHILMENVDFGIEEDNTLVSLRDVMMIRAGKSMEIRDLGLSRCYNVAEQDVDKLKEVFTDVRWDGLDLESDDEDGFYSDEGFFPPVYPSFRSAFEDMDDFLVSPAP